MRHILSVLVENKFGVLARVSGLFSARGYNISSLAVSETYDPTISCMTIVVDAKDEAVLDQIKKQLNRLIDVISVVDLTKKEYLERELILVKVGIDTKDKERLKELADKHKACLIQVNSDSAIFELTAGQDKISDFLAALGPLGIKELVRSGRIAMGK